MTTSEACRLAVELTRDLATTRAERDAYQLVAHQAIHALHDAMHQLASLRAQHRRVLEEYADRRRPALGSAA